MNNIKNVKSIAHAKTTTKIKGVKFMIIKQFCKIALVNITNIDLFDLYILQ